MKATTRLQACNIGEHEKLSLQRQIEKEVKTQLPRGILRSAPSQLHQFGTRFDDMYVKELLTEMIQQLNQLG